MSVTDCPYEEMRDHVLRFCYGQTVHEAKVYLNDVVRGVPPAAREKVAETLRTMCLDGLAEELKGSHEGGVVQLTAMGVDAAEQLELVGQDVKLLHQRARVAELRRLTGRSTTNDSPGPSTATLREWAVQVLELHGDIRNSGHDKGPLARWTVTPRGRDTLRRADEQAQIDHEYVRLARLAPQARGKALEGLLIRALTLQGLRCQPDAGGDGEQIDLTVEASSEHFVGECKWEKDRLQPKVIDQMAGRMLRRPSFYSGVIFSMSGFTKSAWDIASRIASHRVIHLIGLGQTEAIIRGESRFTAVIAEQRRQLAAHGRISEPQLDSR